MNYSTHTFELTLILDANKFDKLKNRAYEKSKKKHRVFADLNKHIDTGLADQGIKVEYHDDTYKKRIKLIVNPTRVLGGDDVIKLWKPKAENISKLLSTLAELIADYFNSKYELDDFTLTRMDFTVNIDVSSSEKVAAYIKVLRRIGKVKGFAPQYAADDDRIDAERSFDLEGNSNGIVFTAYDKEAQSGRKEARGVLRVEVRLTKPKAIRKCTVETKTSKQIESLALNSKHIFLETFVRIVPYGDYYKKPQAVKLITEKIHKKKPREKMLRLVELITKKKSLYLALKEMNDRNIEKVMAMFAELNISPVTISKRNNVKYLKNLYNYLLD